MVRDGLSVPSGLPCLPHLPLYSLFPNYIAKLLPFTPADNTAFC